jgi:hypothetical protein
MEGYAPNGEDMSFFHTFNDEPCSDKSCVFCFGKGDIRELRKEVQKLYNKYLGEVK